ncbi:ABC transporter permease [Bradyrhizobium sp.]|uniref:ABC transporter permease n=1 Tax=Bradyrhizobium sp. TaxID=376 RepID=UPI0039E56CED
MSGVLRHKSVVKYARALGGFGICILCWEIVRALQLIDPRDLPSVVTIVRTAITELADGPLLLAVMSSLAAWAPGLLLAVVIGTAVGIALALLPTLEIATRPILEFLRPIPSVALIPIALLTLGIGIEMQLTMIVFASVWPIVFSVKAGVEAVDPRFQETGRIFGVTGGAGIRRIIIPSVLPALSTGIRTASAIALVLTITVEMLTGRPGIGRYIDEARLNGLVAQMWAAIFMTGVVGYLVNAVMLAAERRLLPWSADNRDN